MTPLGMKLLDTYYKIVHFHRRCGDRCNLTDRDIFVLNALVDFESQVFRKTEEVAVELGLTGERVRQLYRRALNRIAMASTKSKYQSGARLIRNIIESKGQTHGGSIHMGIIMLWKEDLSEYSDKIIIPFLSGLCHTCKDDREETKIVYKNGKREFAKKNFLHGDPHVNQRNVSQDSNIFCNRSSGSIKSKFGIGHPLTRKSRSDRLRLILVITAENIGVTNVRDI
ncbi:hypothetical protein ECE50_003140 [Chitinophaga sp. Mgbs1]|uniref:Uncharacterized protein n=1 Tax=Chitinophaga solisilvae TaxID=1233460 RepID=A0A433W8L0_9BACT|nr:hypothetical protein [Chitinophaga solisilvae]